VAAISDKTYALAIDAFNCKKMHVIGANVHKSVGKNKIVWG